MATHLAAFCELGSAFVDKQVASRSKDGSYVPPVVAHPSKLEHLYGCSSCNYSEVGCKHCWDTPFATRPAARAKPNKAHYQHLPPAPTFRPTAEQFKDPFAYLASIAPEAYKAGIALIIPPESWAPPIQMLDQETGMLRKDFQVPTRIQPTHLLCKRYPTPSGAPPVGSASSSGGGNSSSSPGTPKKEQQDQATGGAAKRSNAVAGRCSKSSMEQQKAALAAAAAAAVEGREVILNPAHWDAVATAAEATDGQFGYEHLEDPLTLHDFHRYADWAKRRHFNGPLMAGDGSSSGRRLDSAAAAGTGSSSSQPAVASASNAWRTFPCTPAARAARGITGRFLPGTCVPDAAAAAATGGDAGTAAVLQDPAETWQEPSIEEVEAEFWRIVEAADEQVEALYGQDIDTATYSSAFPTIKELAQAEARNLVRPPCSSTSAAGGGSNGDAAADADQDATLDPADCCASCRCRRCQLCVLRSYASHPWNINNLPQAKGSVLRFVREDVGGKPITGLMVPWVYVGSCFSAFCWHIEDHGLYSINYNHMGAPKVWYGVPAEAAAALDAAMRDALPYLFERDSLLLHKLITMLSPSQLVARGVPVCRAVQVPGSFVVTFPDAYHAGFNSGFNVAEAVNFAAPDWLPFGSSSVVRYRCESRYMTFSHDAMLINVVREAVAAAGGSHSSSQLALPAPGAQQQRKQEEEEQEEEESSAVTAAAGRRSLLPQQLQLLPPVGLKGQFASQLQRTAGLLKAAEAAAAEEHWRACQQQQPQQQPGYVRLVGPPGSAAAPAAVAPAAAAGAAAGEQQLAVAFSSSVLDSTFWWEAYSDGSWQEAAEAAEEAEARGAARERQRVLARQLLLIAGGATQQQLQAQQLLLGQGRQHHHDLLHLKPEQQGREHHLAAASQQHHGQGQRERVFTMRGFIGGGGAAGADAADAGGQEQQQDDGEFAGPVAGAAAAIAAAGPSKALLKRAARGFTTAAFARKLAKRPTGAAAAAAPGTSSLAAAAAAADPRGDAAVQAIASYIMALAEARRQCMLFKPPSAQLAALAAGELALRLELEGQRQAALALQAGISRTVLMQGSAVAHDPASGVHINTQGVECATCGCDLSLAAVVSEADPGLAVCPEHIADLDGSRSQLSLLLRYAPGQLEALLAAAMWLVPGALEAVRAARERQCWVAAGRFMGGAVLQRPTEAAAAAVEREPREAQQQQQLSAAVVKQEPGCEQQQKAGAVKQEATDHQQQQRQLRLQQPVVEVKLLGRLYNPAELDSKLFEDLEEASTSEEEEEEEQVQLLLQRRRQLEGWADEKMEAEDYAAAGTSVDELVEAEGRLKVKQQQQEKQQQQQQEEEDAAEGASGGDQSSGSWWQDELDVYEDAFGFYTFAPAEAVSDGEAAQGGSDDDFKPTRGSRKRRRGGAAAGGSSRKRVATAAADAVPVVAVDAAA